MNNVFMLAVGPALYVVVSSYYTKVLQTTPTLELQYGRSRGGVINIYIDINTTPFPCERLPALLPSHRLIGRP